MSMQAQSDEPCTVEAASHSCLVAAATSVAKRAATRRLGNNRRSAAPRARVLTEIKKAQPVLCSVAWYYAASLCCC